MMVKFSQRFLLPFYFYFCLVPGRSENECAWCVRVRISCQKSKTLPAGLLGFKWAYMRENTDRWRKYLRQNVKKY